MRLLSSPPLLWPLVVVVVSTACGAPSAETDTQVFEARSKASPPAGFTRRAPAQAEVDLDALEELVDAARDTKSSALVVVQDGSLVGEWCFDGDAEPIEAMSATKSVVSLAVGLLIDDKKIQSLDAPVSDFFPVWSDGPKSSITVRHLLGHTSGLHTRPTTEDIYASDDFVRFGLDAEFVATPGEQSNYNNRAFNILAGVVEKASGERMDRFLKRRLFQPLGIEDTAWSLDPAGNPHAMSGLRVRPMDLAKIGQLMLDMGTWQKRRILSAEWIVQSTKAVRSEFPQLGLSWWLISDSNSTIDGEVIGKWREAGVDEGFIEKVLPLKGRVFGRDEFFAVLKEVFGGTEGLETWYDNTWRRGLPDGKVVSSKVVGYYAEGYLGQFVIVVPHRRLVVVRMRKVPAEAESKDEALKHGFPEILSLVPRL